MKKCIFQCIAPAVLALTTACAHAAKGDGIGHGVTIKAVNDVCQSTTGKHAHATAFFNKRFIKNVISTNNEFQTQGGNVVGTDTLLRLDVWQGKYKIVGQHGNDPDNVVSLPGKCVGHIEVFIPAGTNMGAQFAIEDYLTTPGKGQGLIVRTGQLDQRSKFDIFVDIKEPFTRRRHIVWNNFVGMPNPSGEMSIMRFERGQYYSCVNSGETQGSLKFQVFDVDGNFLGVTEGCNSAPKSVHVTPDVTTLKYFDLSGNPVDVSSAIGRGYIKMTGRPNTENGGLASPFTSAVSIYSHTNPRKAAYFPYWDNYNFRLLKSTITFARRNAGNDTLGIGQ